MNRAYKHLDAKIRVAELTLGQWVGVLAGLCVGLGWGLYLSPLGEYATVFSAVYLGALPVGAGLIASGSEFDVVTTVRAAIRWRRAENRFVAGPGASSTGYRVRPVSEGEGRARRPRSIDLASLWDE